MNIGILGLLPEQVRFVQQEFPHHSLRFLEQDELAKAPQFAKGCDKVIVLTKFVSHDIVGRIPKQKAVVLGSQSSTQKLKQVLSTLPTPVKTTTPPAPALPAKKTQTFIRAGKEVVRDVGNEVDWSPLDTAQQGDEVRIARPSAVTLKAFEQRLTAGRSYRKAKRGIVTTPHKIVDGFAVMTVTAVRTCETAPPDATAPTEATQEAAPMQTEIAIEVQRPVVAIPVLTQGRESAFWQSMFIETAKQWPGAPIETIAARADEALRAYNVRASGLQSVQH